MVFYLEYDKETGQVVEIHENEPDKKDKYSLGKSLIFKPGDEFEYSIRVLNVDESQIITSYSSIKNNPQASRILRENREFKYLSMTSSQKYDELDKVNTNLEDLKKMRVLKLKDECSNEIYRGFNSLGCRFGFNELDQSNFTQRMLTVVAGAEGPFKWKTLDSGIQEFTKEEFIQIVNDAEEHKLNQQEKYWQLEAQVLAATTNEEVDAVKW